ncbi:MAG TPA: ribosome small subunit-dependent GTPase A [Chloroflexia bacterium]|nr:ribosome small subunit-dependent GTPase A [Chloroflexia bacterium]
MPKTQQLSFEKRKPNVSALPADFIEGTVMDGSRGLYRVATDSGDLLCSLRGRLRKELFYPDSLNLRQKARRASVKRHDPLAVGDRVRLLPTGAGIGAIEEILARSAASITRDDANADRAHGRLTSVAGIDQLVVVLATRDPVPHLGVLDRFIVLAEAQDLECFVCLNKIDLGLDPALAARFAVYSTLGYPIVRTSVATSAGLDELRDRLAGRTSALLGPSGVGKSSLLNALDPGLALRVGHISDATGKGRHTTSSTRLIPLAGPRGGFLADTAGIRALALGAVAPGRLDSCFREFRPYLGACRYRDCSHREEPGCAIHDAVEAGKLDWLRYANYCQLHEEGASSTGRHWFDAVVTRSLAGPGEFRM